MSIHATQDGVLGGPVACFGKIQGQNRSSIKSAWTRNLQKDVLRRVCGAEDNNRVWESVGQIDVER